MEQYVDHEKFSLAFSWTVITNELLETGMQNMSPKHVKNTAYKLTIVYMEI